MLTWMWSSGREATPVAISERSLGGGAGDLAGAHGDGACDAMGHERVGDGVVRGKYARKVARPVTVSFATNGFRNDVSSW